MMKLNNAELGLFFIENVLFSDGKLTIIISSVSLQSASIQFDKPEAFQFSYERNFRYSDQYKTSPITKVHQGDTAIFRVLDSSYFRQFLMSHKESEKPSCYLVSTADEFVEIISFCPPSMR